MATHITHQERETFYFITFTCYKWLALFEETGIYDYLPFWFSKLAAKGCMLNGYVIMPNHMHLTIYVKNEVKDLNQVMAESKRFLAYEVVKRLKHRNAEGTLAVLRTGVQNNEKAKGKKHQVFRLSFDAKPLDQKGVERVLDYVHHNPVEGKWNLVDDFTKFKYSSAGYYELAKESYFEIVDYREFC
ncbi:MAG: transposase [Fulvivirga sp.]